MFYIIVIILTILGISSILYLCFSLILKIVKNKILLDDMLRNWDAQK